MKLSLLITLLLLLGGCMSSPSSSTMVAWSSTEGIRRLEESAYKIDFFKLASHFEIQDNKLFCGAATSSMILNALRGQNKTLRLPRDTSVLTYADLKYLPKGKWSPFYARYTQNNIFLKSLKSRASVLGKNTQDGKLKKKDRGFQLRQLNDLFSQHGVHTSLRIVDDTLSNEQIKLEMLKNLQQAEDYVVVNFQRAVLAPSKKIGHISPIAAYHEESDSFLLLDVTPNKSGWVWVRAKVLFRAMRTFDTLENRGYLLVKEGKNKRGQNNKSGLNFED